MMLGKRAIIIKNAKEKFLDYLRGQQVQFREIIHELANRDLKKKNLSTENEQFTTSIIDTLASNRSDMMLISTLDYIEKVTHSIVNIFNDNHKIDFFMKELRYVSRNIDVLELMNFHECNMKSEMITEDFGRLSLYLLNSPLKATESLEILMDFVSLNINIGLLNHSGNIVILNPSIISKKGLNVEDISDLSANGLLNSLLNTSDAELSESDRNVKQLLLEVSKESMEDSDTSCFLTYHEVLRDSYLNKIDSYQTEDVDKIISSLGGLGVCEELCQKIRATLNRRLTKRSKKSSVNSYSNIKKQSSCESKYLSDAEYKQIKREIGKYVDMHKMKVKKVLTEEERLYCAHLLLKIGASLGLVKSFFDRTKEKPDLENPIGFYNHTYDKLKFYEQKYDLQRPLDNIRDYLQEIFITSSEDYQFWKDEIKRELDTVIQKLPDSYEYELHQVSSYCKTKQKSTKREN